MSGPALLAAVAALLTIAAVRDALATREGVRDRVARRLLGPLAPDRARSLVATAVRLGVPERLVRAGMEERFSVSAVMATKLGCLTFGGALGIVSAPAAPGRFSLFVVIALPAAGFLAPDALLEREARRRARRLVTSLPDALDLLAVGAASGRSPRAGFAEIAAGEGALARELAIANAEISCGSSQRDALAGLRRRVPATEVASLIAVIERSRRHGSPLAEQLHAQASSLRRDERRRIEEEAARAAPKIQLAVALLLVPSVLLMIAAGLISNAGRLLGGL